MPTSAQLILEAGLAKATTNDPGKLASDGELLGRLNRTYLQVYTMAARQRPDEFASTAQLTLTGTPASLALGSASPALTDVIDIRAAYGVTGTVAAGAKIHLVPETEVRKTFQIAPCMFRRGLTLISRGASGDPVATDVIGITVLDTPTALTTLATNIDPRFPQRHHEMLVNFVALYLDAKDSARSEANFQRLVADQRMCVAAFAADYSLNASAIEQVLNDRVPVAAATGG